MKLLRADLAVVAVAVLLALCSSLTEARGSVLFCKCVCAQNSTIIQLKDNEACSDCTKSYCLLNQPGLCGPNAGKPIPGKPGEAVPPKGGAGSGGSGGSGGGSGTGGKSDTVVQLVPVCFQRDSAKDQFVVTMFIMIVLGLLGYSVVRRYIERRRWRTDGGNVSQSQLSSSSSRHSSQQHQQLQQHQHQQQSQQQQRPAATSGSGYVQVPAGDTDE